MNDDLISRQAAIDALGEEPPVWYDGEDEIAERNQWRRDVTAIKELPSAQPEPFMVTIDHELTKDEVERLKQSMSNTPIVLFPSVQPEPQWIPCSERLPRTNGVYNVTRKISDGFECRNISDACYYDGANTWHDDTRVNHERVYLTDVIAWMPRPKPYKGEES